MAVALLLVGMGELGVSDRGAQRNPASIQQCPPAAQRSAAQRTVSVTLTTTEPGLHAPSRSSFSPYLGGGAVHCVCAFERGCVG